MGVDVFDIVALILGVWFTVRKLDAQGRLASEFPHVPAGEFAAWQTAEVSAYQFGVMGCFSKVLVDLVFTHTVAPDLPFSAARAIGATIDLSWLAVLVVTFLRTSRTRRRRRQLGIVLGGALAARTEEDEDSLEEDEDSLEQDGDSQEQDGQSEDREAEADRSPSSSR